MEDENLLLTASTVAELNTLLKMLIYELMMSNNLSISKTPGIDSSKQLALIDKERKKVARNK